MHELTSNKVSVETRGTNTGPRFSALSLVVNKCLESERWLHGLAASFLFAFGIFHFAGVAVGDARDKLLNVAFPFLTDGQLFLLTGILELGIG